MYIVRNGPPSIDSYGYDGYYGMAKEEVAYIDNFLHILQSFSLHSFYVDRNDLSCFWAGFMGGGQ
jgi:hypothetical protein